MPPPSRSSCVLPATCIPHRARARTRVLACCVQPQDVCRRDTPRPRRANRPQGRHAGRLGEWSFDVCPIAAVDCLGSRRFRLIRHGRRAGPAVPFPALAPPPLAARTLAGPRTPRRRRSGENGGRGARLCPRVRGRCRVFTIAARASRCCCCLPRSKPAPGTTGRPVRPTPDEASRRSPVALLEPGRRGKSVSN